MSHKLTSSGTICNLINFRITLCKLVEFLTNRLFIRKTGIEYRGSNDIKSTLLCKFSRYGGE